MSETTANQCDTGFVLTVSGSGFITSSSLGWNGGDRPTTYISPTQLEVTVTAEDLAPSGTANLTVINPPPGGGLSNVVSFTVQERPEGRILGPVARDIIRYNQDAQGGAGYRTGGIITRWELPVPVYVDSGVTRGAVVDAVEHWREHAGITYTLLDEDAESRLLVRPGWDGLGDAAGRGLVDGTYDNNRARSGLVVINPFTAARCEDCFRLFRHELGHALGFFDHFDGPGLMGVGSIDLSPRESQIMRMLYSLPHGTKVEPTGCWHVVLP